MRLRAGASSVVLERSDMSSSLSLREAIIVSIVSESDVS